METAQFQTAGGAQILLPARVTKYRYGTAGAQAKQARLLRETGTVGEPVRLVSPVDRREESHPAWSGKEAAKEVGVVGVGSLQSLLQNLLGQSPLVLLAQMTNDSIAQCLTPTARNASIKSVLGLVVRKSVCQLMKRKCPRLSLWCLFFAISTLVTHTLSYQ